MASGRNTRDIKEWNSRQERKIRKVLKLVFASDLVSLTYDYLKPYDLNQILGMHYVPIEPKLKRGWLFDEAWKVDRASLITQKLISWGFLLGSPSATLVYRPGFQLIIEGFNKSVEYTFMQYRTP